MRIENGFHFFWNGKFSNWHPAPFTMFGIDFSNSEQAYMWLKAVEFSDHISAAKIIQTPDPDKAKNLGRWVSGYDDTHWSRVRYDRMFDVCYQKFTQNAMLKDFLLCNSHLEIVEASPYDMVWGVGLGEADNRILDKNNWMGDNLLGKVLNAVADKIKENGFQQGYEFKD